MHPTPEAGLQANCKLNYTYTVRGHLLLSYQQCKLIIMSNSPEVPHAEDEMLPSASMKTRMSFTSRQTRHDWFEVGANMG